MNCPQCNAPIPRRRAPDGSLTFACDHCGWGHSDAGDEHAGDDAHTAARPTSLWWNLGLLWFLTLIVLVGPYVGLRLAVIYIAGSSQLPEGSIEARFVSGLNVHYAWIMFVYLVFCWVATPSYDPQNMGLFGGGRCHNPAVTAEHHYNRMMQSLASIVAPGKIVLMTFAVTWQLWRGRV